MGIVQKSQIPLKRVIWLGVVACLVAYTAWWRIATPARAIARAREWGRLAPIPASATRVRADYWHNGFAGAAFVTFTAPPKDIDAFIRASPGVDRSRVAKFTPKYMHVPYPKKIDNPDEWTQHSHFFPSQYPRWYDPTIRIKGRGYSIPWHIRYCGGIIVDDVRHVVLIKVQDS